MAEVDDLSTSLIRGRSHPHSQEAEQAVLGGVLLNNRAMYDVAVRYLLQRSC